MNERPIVTEIDGYPTFNLVEDKLLRTQNRGNIIVNIIEDMTLKKATKESIWDMVNDYLTCIPEHERKDACNAFYVAASLRNTLTKGN